MASLTNAQHDSLRGWIRKTLPAGTSKASNQTIQLRTASRSPNSQSNSATFALLGLNLLNLPAFLFLQSLARTAVQTMKKHPAPSAPSPTIFAGRPLTDLSPVLRAKDAGIALADKQDPFRPVMWWMSRLGNSAQGLRSGYFWTLITSSFVHIDLLHLLNSAIGLYSVSGPCARIPGMDAWHVGIIALGSSIATNLAGLVQQSYFLRLKQGADGLPVVGFGASGIVSAFMAVGALGRPGDHVGFSVGSIALSIPLRVFTGIHVLHNTISLMSLLGIVRLPKPAPAHIGYAAHLSGAAFGAIYYLLVLRSHPTSRLSGRKTTGQPFGARRKKAPTLCPSCSKCFETKG